MKRLALLLAFTVLNAATALAQHENNPLSFMVGKWKGSGYMMTREGKQSTTITENVVCKLNCAVLAVEGQGTKTDSLTQQSIIVHDAFGIISHDPKNNKWVMRAYKKGEVIDAEIVIVSDKVIRWELPLPHNGGTMRFTTDFTTANTWKGTGEYSKDGTNWMVMMQTELTRVQE